MKLVNLRSGPRLGVMAGQGVVDDLVIKESLVLEQSA